MKIYAILIGINDYPVRPLRQCVDDARKMEKYLEGLKSANVTPDIIKLTNSRATKENIAETIRTHFGKASSDDVAFLYYSGHGAQEQTAGLFQDEHDGLLECLVCYGTGAISAEHFLANKEIRYLFHQLPNQPHLVTIIDACHSGDMARAYQDPGEDNESMIRRVAGTFPGREYSKFLFAGDATVEQQNANGKTIFIPFKNHVHIAACLSSESSWEDAKGGVFTRYLIDLLKATQGNLSYLDITRWAKISLQGVTRKKQTPTISVQGEGSLNGNSPWLNLHKEIKSIAAGKIIPNGDEWIYTRGSMLGVKQGMPVIISPDNGNEITARVKAVELDQSFLDIARADLKKLDAKKTSYPARTEDTTFSPLLLSIRDIDQDTDTLERLRDIVKANKHVEITESDNADFSLNIFNALAYFTLPDQDFQPLAEQIPLNDQDLLVKNLNHQLQALVKWHHFYALENPGKDYDSCPLRLSAEVNTGSWVNITNDICRMQPQKDRLKNGSQFQKIRIKVENTGDERLYVGVLTLNSDLSITSKPFDGKVVALNPGDSKMFYDYQASGMVYTTLEPYKEVYNWKEEWLYYKLIFYNHEDFSVALNDVDYLQPALDPPLTIEKTSKGILRSTAKGEGGGEMEEVRKKWGTCQTRLELENAEYNMISGDLKLLWESYVSNSELAPFIKELYFEDYFNGKTFEPRLKQNKNQSAEEAQRATDIWYVKLFNKLYNISRRRKFRKQKHHTGPIVVAEGDSWFLFPKPGVRDTLDYIMDHYRLLSLADAGDEIADYIKNNELLKAVIDQQPAYVLISGGGNDILGAEIKDILRPDVKNGQTATDFLDVAAFNKKMDFLRESYVGFFNKISALRPGVKIFIHGYDYIRSNPDAETVRKGWANRYMIEAGIGDADAREKIIRHLVDTFNGMLQDFAKTYAFVSYVNHRGTVALNEWMDEIHPNNIGYQKVANNFLKEMEE